MRKLFMILALCMPILAFISCDDDDNDTTYTSKEDFVDLGLSVKWATKNIGANADTDYGYYFAWGETVPFEKKDSSNTNNYKYNLNYFNFSIDATNYVKKVYNWHTYKYIDDDKPYDMAQAEKTGEIDSAKFTLNKYNTDPQYGKVDGTTSLNPSDDPTELYISTKGRMPTGNEIEELITKCYWQYTESYHGTGVAGYIVYKAKATEDMGLVTDVNNNTTNGSRTNPKPKKVTERYSLNDTHIFLPSGGHHHDAALYSEGKAARYWTKTLGSAEPSTANCLEFYPESLYYGSIPRICGCMIRPVF